MRGHGANLQLSLFATAAQKDDLNRQHAVRCGQLQTRVAEMRAALEHVRALTTKGATGPSAQCVACGECCAHVPHEHAPPHEQFATPKTLLCALPATLRRCEGGWTCDVSPLPGTRLVASQP